MTESKVARRYAKSLLGLAAEKNITEKVYSDMQMIYSACDASRDLALLMKKSFCQIDKLCCSNGFVSSCYYFKDYKNK